MMAADKGTSSGRRSPRSWDAAPAGPLAHHQRALPRFDGSQKELRASGALGKAAGRVPRDVGQFLWCAPENPTSLWMSAIPSATSGLRVYLQVAKHDDLIIHQLKYPHDDADLDINVIFPIERLQELFEEGHLGGLTPNFFSFIGYNMDPEKFERTVAEKIAKGVVEEERADCALLAPVLTDLSSVRRTGPESHRSARCAHGFGHCSARRHGGNQSSACTVSSLAHGSSLWRALSSRSAAPHVLAALGLLESSQQPGTILDLPIKWADVRREAKTLTEQGRKLSVPCGAIPDTTPVLAYRTR